MIKVMGAGRGEGLHLLSTSNTFRTSSKSATSSDGEKSSGSVVFRIWDSAGTALPYRQRQKLTSA